MNTLPSSVLSAYNLINMPSQKINTKDKNREWISQYLQYILSVYFSNNTIIPYSSWDKIDELRDIAHGRMNVDKFKNLYNSKVILENIEGDTEATTSMIDNNGIYKAGIETLDNNITADTSGSYRNINYDEYPVIMPKYVDALINKWSKYDFDISVNAIDRNSALERDKKEGELFFEMMFGNDIKKMNDMRGIPNLDNKFVPNDINQLEQYKKVGGIKLRKEIAYEIAFKLIRNNNELLLNNVFHDYICINAMVIKDETNLIDKKIEIKYVNPKYFVSQYTRDYGLSKANYAGHFEQYKISELLETGQFTEEQLYKVAFTWNGYLNNPNIDNLLEKKSDNIAYSDWSNFNVLVFNGEFFCYDYDDIEEVDNNIDKDEDEVGGVEGTRVIRTGKLIVGTTYVFDDGIKENNTGELSYHAWRSEGKSIIERCIFELDQICLAAYRYQNDKARALPDGWRLNWSAFKNMALANPGSKPEQWANLFFQSGIMVYEESAEPGVGTTHVPVEKLIGGMGNALREFIDDFTFHHNNIMNHIGFNDVVAGTMPKPDTTIGVSKLALDASNNITEGILTSWINISLSCAKNLASRIYFTCKYDKEFYNKYAALLSNSIFGERGEDLLDSILEGDKSLTEYAFTYNMKPTIEEKQQLLEAAKSAMINRVISYSDFCYIQNMQDMNLKLAQIYFARKEEEGIQKQQKMSQMNMEKAKEINLEQIKAKSDLESRKVWDKVKGNLLVEITRAQLRYIENEQKDKLDQATEAIKSTSYIINDAIKKVMDLQMADITQAQQQPPQQQQQQLPQQPQGGGMI